MLFTTIVNIRQNQILLMFGSTLFRLQTTEELLCLSTDEHEEEISGLTSSQIAR